MVFVDRVDAGRQLATLLHHLRGEPVVVLGLPRGGVPVAFEVAQALDAPLDVIVVRKLGVPYQPELGMGAIGEDGVRVVNDEVVRAARISDADIAAVEARERVELERRARRFRGERARIPIEGRTALIVDDGIATGSTALAACRVARAHGAARVVLAVPVAPPGWTARIGRDADEFVAVQAPEPFIAIGHFYRNFSPTSDEEVVRCLARAAAREPAIHDSPPGSRSDPPPVVAPMVDEEVEVRAGAASLAGRLTVPPGAGGIVAFAHGSGSNRHSPRNRAVAAVLHEARVATLLFDLLTPDEERDRANTFDIDLLARRLVDATTWLRGRPALRSLPIGYFGASTGAAAALLVAAELGSGISAIVSRGGRPDLAAARLAAVTTPTLLIVGGRDEAVLDLNRRAQTLLRCENHLAVVPGATHLFEEPGALRAVATLARDWFVSHLATARRVPV